MIFDNRYKVIERLGIGAWAVVYKVRDLRTSRIYAMKIFQNIDAKVLYEKFTAEDMFLITQLEHPNLMDVVSFGSIGKHIYYLSQFYEGKTLSQFNFSSGSVEDLYEIIVQVCYGLSELHSRGIIHKDLKPDNILYYIENDRIRVRILDFGFTKVDLQKNQQFISGTLPYIAPELYRGKRAFPESDFYALGVTLYRLTTGTLPFTLEQLSGMMTGARSSLFPKFPREFNQEIPPNLEKLILKLMERNREDRFSDAPSVISYINRTQTRQHSFSTEYSLLNSVQYNSCLMREDYTHNLLDYMHLVEKKNGKLIVLSGEDGLGKNNILTLFRYHLLTDDYYLFDYSCSPKNKDPFFALMREFLSSLKNNKEISEKLVNISEKMKRFIYDNEDVITSDGDYKKEIKRDYGFAKSFVEYLSEDKPLVFIIRAGHYLTTQTIDFINYISATVKLNRILILLSVDNIGSLSGLIHPINIQIEPFTLEETKTYVEELLRVEVPLHICQSLLERTGGNPGYIKEILLDLIENKIIWKKDKFKFDLDWNGYKLPENIIHNVYNNLSHLKQQSYKALQTLAVTYTPLSFNLMEKLLNTDDKKLFFIVQDSINNHVLQKKGDYYYFAFLETKERLFNETSKEFKKSVSQALLDYFQDKKITEILICEGVRENAKLAEDYLSIREYSLKLFELYSAINNQEKSFQLICEIISLDFSKKIKIKELELLKDLELFQTTAELTGKATTALRVFDSIQNLPDIFQKYYIRGLLDNVIENYEEAETQLNKALKKAITGRQRISAMINLLWTSISLEKDDKAEQYINELETYKMTLDLKTAFVDRKAVYLYKKGRTKEAIQIMSDFIPEIEHYEMKGYYAKLGSFYNNLALFYSTERAYDEAFSNFQMAEKLWGRINYQRSLGMVYNNIGDLHLKQGNTKEALNYFNKALQICSVIEQLKCEVLTHVNFGEANIKLGNFLEAEKFLETAKNKNDKCKDKSLTKSIIDNLALAKSKIVSYDNYYLFIKEKRPDLVEQNVKKLDPLIKSYIYFLLDMGQTSVVEKLTVKNTKLDYVSTQDEEFFYQIQGLLDMQKKRYSEALENFFTALNFAEKNRSSFAQAVIYTKIIKCFIQLENRERAEEYLEKARKLVTQYNYGYWERVVDLLTIQVNLLDSQINFRSILRDLFVLLRKAKDKDYFQLEIKTYFYLTIVFRELKAKKRANQFNRLYQKRIRESIIGLPNAFQKSLIVNIQADISDPTDLVSPPITKRESYLSEPWQEQLYELLKLDEVERFKFFIGKIIERMFVPELYSLILIEEYNKRQRPFINKNFKLKRLFSKEIEKLIKESIRDNRILVMPYDNAHIMAVPLRFKGIIVGCLIVGDAGELSYTRQEQILAQDLKLHLTSLLIRIKDIGTIKNSTKQMKQLMNSSYEFFSIKELDKLEQEIVSFCIDFIQCDRIFLIKKDIYGNFIYQIAMDSTKNILRNNTHISKSVISEVYNNRRLVLTMNAITDSTFKNSISVQDYNLHSIFCAPLIIDNEIHGLLYIDNYNHPNRELVIDRNMIDIFLMQASIALKNAVQYHNLMKKNMELHSLDLAKTEFMGIISHELNTPLMVLQNLISRLKKDEITDPEEKNRAISNADTSLKRILDKLNDIYSLTKYNLVPKLKKDKIDVRELLDIIVSEAEIISRERKMIFHLEVSEKIPQIDANWEAFYLMVYHIVLNAIRYTKDFGTIKVGARKSSFQNEEIDSRETLVIYIQDNGMGIPERELERIFIPFHELIDNYSHHSGTIEYKSSGLGVGLSIAKRIAELHSGQISIKSKENEGTTVFVLIPFSIVDGTVIKEKEENSYN